MTWYTGNPTYDTALTIGFVFAAFVLFAGRLVQTPYGRFASPKWGVALSPKLGWWLMELPATVVFLAVYVQGSRALEPTPLVLALIWAIHYGNRGWFFPLTLRVAKGRKTTFGLAVVAIGMFVTSIHGYLNAAFFSEYGAQYTTAWLTDPRFLAGLAVYYSGYFGILHSERIVRNLRPKDAAPSAGKDYKIPYGGLFRYVSSPAYFAELVAWAGFALMTWSLAGVLIFLISAGNLVPRAFATHKWYRETFPDYPKERKALVPFVA